MNDTLIKLSEKYDNWKETSNNKFYQSEIIYEFLDEMTKTDMILLLEFLQENVKKEII